MGIPRLQAHTYIHTYIYTYIYIYGITHTNMTILASPLSTKMLSHTQLVSCEILASKTDASMRKIVKVMAPYEKKTCGAPVY